MDSERDDASGRRLCRSHSQKRETGGLVGDTIIEVELVINAETARMLGITVPSALLSTANEVIE